MKYYIYKLTDNTNRVYIGMTKDIKKRYSYHHSIKNNCGSRVFNREYMRMEIIFEDEMTLEQAHSLEISFIHMYASMYDCVNIQNILTQKEGKHQRAQRYSEENKIRWGTSKTPAARERDRIYASQRRKYRYSWGGDYRSSNNLLNIDIDLFK